MSDLKNKSLSKILGLVLQIIGFCVGIIGFGDAINATWGMSIAFRGFAELLLGILFLLLGNGLINFGRNS